MFGLPFFTIKSFFFLNSAIYYTGFCVPTFLGSAFPGITCPDKGENYTILILAKLTLDETPVPASQKRGGLRDRSLVPVKILFFCKIPRK